MKREWISRGAFALSLVTHAWILGATPAPLRSRAKPPELTQMVQFEVAEPPAEQKPEPPPSPPPEPIEPEPPRPPEPAPEPALDAPPPVDEPVEAQLPELTGTTLLAEGPGAFVVEEGSGRSRRGAIRAGVSSFVERGTGQIEAKPKPNPRAMPAPVRAVPVASLSRRPRAPSLGGLLRENYPPEARRQGRSGQVKVRAMIDPSGKIKQVHVTEQSDEAFGQACRKTLLGTDWGAPLDAAGQPVATWIIYRCTFRVDD